MNVPQHVWAQGYPRHGQWGVARATDVGRGPRPGQCGGCSGPSGAQGGHPEEIGEGDVEGSTPTIRGGAMEAGRDGLPIPAIPEGP